MTQNKQDHNHETIRHKLCTAREMQKTTNQQAFIVHNKHPISPTKNESTQFNIYIKRQSLPFFFDQASSGQLSIKPLSDLIQQVHTTTPSLNSKPRKPKTSKTNR